MLTFDEGQFDIVVIGAGHAGCEAALAAARLGKKTCMLTLNLDSIAFMACNPSIGGTGKGHLVREIDALGGEMGKNADKTALQTRILNEGKGEAVQSLRCQCDKNAYHREMKRTLENTENLRILQGEAAEILTDGGKVTGVITDYGGVLGAKSVIIATGVYLNAEVITGDVRRASGPSGFAAATKLTRSLINLGFRVRRFKTGTPARLDGRTVDFGKCARQAADENAQAFSFENFKTPPENKAECFITYTNRATHGIILDNLSRSPLYNGGITSTGPRYCPSIETKVVRFSDKERHQIFLEPEGADTNEIYAQGMSSSLPHDVQKKMYNSVEGLENAQIMRYAYAIEYDCIDTLDVYPTLEFKKVSGIYTAGQINGTSGYEEAAAQGLIAGINAVRKLDGQPPFILRRDEAYIGVLIDDLVTKGTEEPYRIMTSRAEHALFLRHDLADMRLTPKIFGTGLYTKERERCFTERKELYERALAELDKKADGAAAARFAEKYGITAGAGDKFSDLLKRGADVEDLCGFFGILKDIPKNMRKTAQATVKYEGYLKKSLGQIERAKKLEEKTLLPDINYSEISGLRLEAREKLERVRPATLGQAGRISGVNPADVTVLMIWLATKQDKR